MKKIIYIALAGFISVACNKVEVNEYEVNPVTVNSNGVSKSRQKSDLQLISIMFSDVFGRAISQNELQMLANTYNSLGDKQVIINRFTWRFLNDPSADLPANTELVNNPTEVIETLFARYLSRPPGEMEVWYYQNWIADNPDLEVKHLAFVLLTSDEYKFY